LGRDRALKTLHLEPTDRVGRYEAIDCPEFERAATGIDPYQKPRSARIRLAEVLDLDHVGNGIPKTDEPVVDHFADGSSSKVLEDGSHVVRWGAGATSTWEYGAAFADIKQVLDYDPLEHDMPGTLQEMIAQQQQRTAEARQRDGQYMIVATGTYKTLFQWGIMTFGWELFLEAAAAEPDAFGEVLSRFEQCSAVLFEAAASSGADMVTAHDDICMASGPVFRPDWYEKHIFPAYERMWRPVKEAGIPILFLSDGNVTPVADAVFAAGADGIFCEPYTDLESIVDKYADSKFFVGNVDGRILAFKGPEEIEAEVQRVMRMAHRAPGFFCMVSNHIAHNVPVENAFHYFKMLDKYGSR
jgi:uroporphyrinogen decarboxylase